MIAAGFEWISLKFYVAQDDAWENIRGVVGDHGGEVQKIARTSNTAWEVDAHFSDITKAAIFLASISADPERAAMFKMFWSGE